MTNDPSDRQRRGGGHPLMQRQQGILWAKWHEIMDSVRDGVVGVLTEHDELDPPPTRAEIQWAEGIAKKVVRQVDYHLDGYYVDDVLEDEAKRGASSVHMPRAHVDIDRVLTLARSSAHPDRSRGNTTT